MDLTLYFFIAFFMAIATWLVGLVYGRRAREAVISIATLSVILPMVIIFIAGMWGMLKSPEVAEEIASSTIELTISYVAEKLPSIIISDVCGIIAGGIVSMFTRQRR